MMVIEVVVVSSIEAAPAQQRSLQGVGTSLMFSLSDHREPTSVGTSSDMAYPSVEGLSVP
jgi:hypothetical protein